MTVYAYSRTTQLEEVEDATLASALETDALAMQTYGLARGWFISQSLIDRGCRWDQSLDDRPHGAALLAKMKEGDVLLCAQIQRLCSSSAEVSALIKSLHERGIALHCCEVGADLTDAATTLTFSEASTLFAALESRRSAERIKGVFWVAAGPLASVSTTTASLSRIPRSNERCKKYSSSSVRVSR